MKTLPPPPVPPNLREMLKDYPRHLDELQRSLNDVIARPLHGTPLFEQALWSLEGALSSFISEARDELKVAESSGDPEITSKAEAKVRLMLHASQLRGLHELKDYFDENKEIVE